MLTDEDLNKVLGFGEFTTESTKVTLTHVARAIEAAVLEKLSSAEPVVYIQPNHLDLAKHQVFLCRAAPCQLHDDFVPLYEHPPAPSAVEAERDAARYRLVRKLLSENMFDYYLLEGAPIKDIDEWLDTYVPPVIHIYLGEKPSDPTEEMK